MRLLPICLLLALPLCHAEPARRTKKSNIADMQPLMVKRDKSLLEESFEKPGWEKTIKPYKGDFQVVEGQLKVGPQEGANHPPQASFYAPMTDVVAQLRFRLDGAKRISVMLSSPERSENVASVTVDAKEVTIARMSGWGGTTKVIGLAKKSFQPDKDQWHTLLVEWCGTECVVQIDDKFVLHATDPELVRTKGQFALQSGGAFAWYDDLKLSTATLDPEWEKRKSKVESKSERGR